MPGRFGFADKQELADAINRGTFVPAGRNFSGIDLSGVRLTYEGFVDETRLVDFAGCDLTGANFTGALLVGVSFRGARMDGADFADARLSNCRLDRAEGTGVRFERVKDDNGIFDGAVLPGAGFHGAALYRSKLRGADLRRADFRGIVAYEADFNSAHLDAADLRDGSSAELCRNANLAGTTANGVRFDPGADAEWNASVRACDARHRAGIAGKQRAPDGHTVTDACAEVRTDVPGCSRQVAKRNGSFVRYDSSGRVHCDGGPAVRDAKGNEAWFEHGEKRGGPAHPLISPRAR